MNATDKVIVTAASELTGGRGVGVGVDVESTISTDGAQNPVSAP